MIFCVYFNKFHVSGPIFRKDISQISNKFQKFLNLFLNFLDFLEILEIHFRKIGPVCNLQRFFYSNEKKSYTIHHPLRVEFYAVHDLFHTVL